MADILIPVFLAATLVTTNLSGTLKSPGGVQTQKVDSTAPFSVSPNLAGDNTEKAYEELLGLDDAAQEEVDRWIREADVRADPADEEALSRRIRERLDGVEKAYRDFLQKHPSHVDAHVAFGSFYNDIGQEVEAHKEWEIARDLDPKKAVVYNNLAGIYGHRGPVTNAFINYEKAIELEPNESLYYHNFATTVFLFRQDVMEHYKLADEQKVFDKSLALYRKALELDPKNFILASDLAQTYYLIKPPRHQDALAAWNHAMTLASDDLEREGIKLHLARVSVQAGLFNEARTNLSQVSHTNLTIIKDRILKTLEDKEKAAQGNAPRPKP